MARRFNKTKPVRKGTKPSSKEVAPEKHLEKQQENLEEIKKLPIGTVLTRARNGILVFDETGKNYWCRVRHKGSKGGMPVPGDLVRYTPSTDVKDGVIHAIEPRKSHLGRYVFGRIKEIVANMDQLAIIATPGEPVVSTRLVDRMMIGASVGHIKPVIILNKIDLFGAEELDTYSELWQKLDIPIFKVSAETGEGTSELHDMLQDKKTLLLGASGVGKSTLLNHLIENLDLDTRAISEASGRGVHTTTFTKLYPFGENGTIADSPGMREFYPIIETPTELKSHFPEFKQFEDSCKYQDCDHLENSDGCAINEAAESGDIHPDRYKSYLLIYKSLVDGPKRGRGGTQG